MAHRAPGLPRRERLNEIERRRRDAQVREIHEPSPDIGGGLDLVCSDLLEGDWVAVRAEENRYKIHQVPNGSDSSRAV